MAKLLLVEDDLEIAGNVLSHFTERSHSIEHAPTCADALALLSASDFDLLILDWNLPDGNGVEVLRSYRAKSGLAPALMLTARNTIEEKETGFRAGADDYLTKPFLVRELSVRVEALLRRPREIIEQTIKVRHISIHCHTCKVFKNDEEIRLLPKEYGLLEFLMRHLEQVFSADQLLERVWKSDSESMRETVTSTVNRLRNKIDVPGQRSIIENIRGLGYRISKE